MPCAAAALKKYTDFHTCVFFSKNDTDCAHSGIRYISHALTSSRASPDKGVVRSFSSPQATANNFSISCHTRSETRFDRQHNACRQMLLFGSHMYALEVIVITAGLPCSTSKSINASNSSALVVSAVAAERSICLASPRLLHA